MSLATRCPVCSTVFRVVQDQLKVSEGWVRCGRCAKVFNAFEGLFDLERELAASTPPSVTPAQRVLRDLAERNRNPKPRGDWPGDDFDAGSAFRGSGHAPLSSGAPHSEPAPLRTTPAAFSPLPARSAPSAPFAAPRPATANPWTTSRPAAWSQPPKAAAPPAGPASRPAPLSEPAAAWSPSKPAPLSAPAGAPAAPVSAPIAPMVPTAPPAAIEAAPPAAPSAPAAAPPVHAAATTAETTPVPAGPPAATAGDSVALRNDPAPLGAQPADAGPSSGSYESLFRSTGELDPPTAHPSSLDIVLDGQDSARDGDAVDSRLLSFVQQADKAARWQRPQVRAGLAMAAAVLGLALAAQVAIGARDGIAARWPGTRALLQALCAPLDCRIEAPRRIERLAVESSGLTRMAEGPVYRLAMVLRNRGDTALMLPAVDLSLTDSGGALVSRRIFNAAELGASGSTIEPGQEMPLQALLMSADRPLTGYTIEIFYP